MKGFLIAILFGIVTIPVSTVAQTFGSFTDDYIWQERFNEAMADAEEGDAKAQYKIGEMYEKGRGTPKDLKQAFKWYQKASEQYYMKAQYRLGYMYYSGAGVSINKAKAFTFLRKPAAHGNVRAQFYLGHLYSTGQGVEKDTQKALMWYRRSSLGGFKLAKKLLGEHNTASGTILQGKWMKREKPAEFLPSIVTECEKQSNTVVECMSGELKSNIGVADITYFTKAILFDITMAGDFKVAYRNKILSIDNSVAKPEGEDKNQSITAKVSVKKGWQETEHKLECIIKDQSTIDCVKDNIRKVKFNSNVNTLFDKQE